MESILKTSQKARLNLNVLKTKGMYTTGRIEEVTLDGEIDKQNVEDRQRYKKR